ncbi:hypothetical protein V6N13_120360 [Hibiscus sabdariffa]|uniref:Uncharacterized protein n=1 Tax=Hibiscus sabdariffa TaxID=183260 RepID=A0ABR2E409_9ROSI
MAKTNLIFALAFLFALLISAHAIRFSKIEKDEYYSGKHVTKILVSDHNEMKYSRGMHGADHDALAADTNDFRPTTPGHSPSIGHSTPPNGH